MRTTGRDVRPLLSIVIPTRERARYLSKCLDAAIACTDPRLEIVVSDNANKDDTAETVLSKRDPRIRYINTGRRVSVSENLEFAFARARGDHLLYCGDDDAVMPQGVRALMTLLDHDDPDVVNWAPAAFTWPGPDCRDGELQLRRACIAGGLYRQEPLDLLAEVCGGRSPSPYLYWGCVSRRVVERAQRTAGRYFYYIDIGAASFCNLALAERILFMGRPAFVHGVSPSSTFVSATTFEAEPTGRSAAHWAFMAENAMSTSYTIDIRCRCLWAMAFDALLLTSRLFGLRGMRIDARAWKTRITQELALMPEPHRSEQMDMVNAFLETAGFTPLRPLIRLEETAPSLLRRRRPGFRFRLGGLDVTGKRLSLKSREHFMQDVASAASVADYIVGEPPLFSPRGWGSQAAAWCGAVGRAAGARFGRGFLRQPLAEPVPFYL